MFVMALYSYRMIAACDGSQWLCETRDSHVISCDDGDDWHPNTGQIRIPCVEHDGRFSGYASPLKRLRSSRMTSHRLLERVRDEMLTHVQRNLKCQENATCILSQSAKFIE